MKQAASTDSNKRARDRSHLQKGRWFSRYSSRIARLRYSSSLYRQLTFRNWIGAAVKIVSRADTAIQEIKLRRFDWIFLDRDLVDGFGEDVAAYLSEIQFAGRVIVHSGIHSKRNLSRRP